LGKQLEWKLNHKFPVNDDGSMGSCSFELLPLRGMDFLKGQSHESNFFRNACLFKSTPSTCVLVLLKEGVVAATVTA
jgi:hypothetical protein